eukprot:gnl/Spiro4/2346_TR1127_c0_g1_i1.p1 gnl/Spiro4/2346_TR1127_c0_g1~~gnl/Spiro4/2346_TR1127_c0_g1_i1.p1  ORF type:complete len:560 (-),score=110.81 gnl/Spiro4/2346_TR1127_c0_g1_i1:56-1708(-)
MGRFLASFFLLLCATGAFASYSDWALTDAELTQSRGGSVRTSVSVFTSGNRIVPLIDAEPFFTQLYRAIESTTAGDWIHAESFNTNGAMMLIPDGVFDGVKVDPATTTLTETLVRALKRGVEARLMINTNGYLPTEAIKFCHTVNPYCRNTGGNDCCISDVRHNGFSGAIHDKMWTIQRNGSIVAFMGSMDVTQGRYDTSRHDNGPARRAQPAEMNLFYGWHGNTFMIDGPAARDASLHLYDRWHDPVAPWKPYKSPPFKMPELLTADDVTLANSRKLLGASDPFGAAAPNLNVQLLRTAACKAAQKSKLYQNWAPHGEYSLSAGFAKMVSQAKRYIYLCDQFMFFPEALKLVADRLPYVDAVIIMTTNGIAFGTTLPAGIQIDYASNMRYYYFNKAMEPLLKDPVLKQKVHVFQLAKPGADHVDISTLIYNHAKNYYVDDAYMIVGSSGMELSGFTNDVECSVGIYDSTHDEGSKDNFVTQFRRREWSEYLGINATDPRLEDPVSSVKLWYSVADSGTAFVRRYEPKQVPSSFMADMVYNFYELDGRCT